MIERVIDQAAVSIADTASPHTLFCHPAMQLILNEIAEFRAETSPVAVQRLIQKLVNKGQIVDRIEAIADRFTNVSIQVIFDS